MYIYRNVTLAAVFVLSSTPIRNTLSLSFRKSFPTTQTDCLGVIIFDHVVCLHHSRTLGPGRESFRWFDYGTLSTSTQWCSDRLFRHTHISCTSIKCWFSKCCHGKIWIVTSLSVGTIIELGFWFGPLQIECDSESLRLRRRRASLVNIMCNIPSDR